MKRIERLFGEAVRRKRLNLGLSQEDFADKAGIHRTYVSSIELGKVQVSIGIAAKLANALEVPLSEIWKEIERDQGGAGRSQRGSGSARGEPASG